VRIAPLVERPDLAAQVAAWGLAEWGHLNPGQTLAQRVIRIQGKMNVDRVPVAFVALDDSDSGAGGIIGTASLIFDDLEGDPRNPWLASVYVPPEQRKKGIASALVRTVGRGAPHGLFAALSFHLDGTRSLRRPRLATA